jgi:hypothetical protein
LIGLRIMAFSSWLLAKPFFRWTGAPVCDSFPELLPRSNEFGFSVSLIVPKTTDLPGNVT